MITFQELIKRLNDFWEKQGCLIHQGYDLEVGAGTFNPATFLRSLGPEPYKAAYVEPSRRPSDGRYGENPNRFQLFHQYQVVLKPSPLNIQALYLQSLEAIGLNCKEHDIRFVHDDWEGPTLGAWGLGWEVWIDGMEATQFTYFQMVGSQPLYPVTAELTYGLERLAMFLQGVDSFLDIHWNEQLTFKEISQRHEIEWSHYNFSQATVSMWKSHFDDFEAEAKQLIAKNLPLPAYDFVLKASHAFNMLEARGAISVTERTGYIGRIRDLAKLIAEEYISSREKMGFPLLGKEKKREQSKIASPSEHFNPQNKGTFLLEIGSEELPATFVPIGCQNLENSLRALFTKEELSFDSIETFGTPRRLAIKVNGLAEGSHAKAVQKKGPRAEIAFVNQVLSPQGMGFFKSCQLSPCTLEEVAQGKVEGLSIKEGYLFYDYTQTGISTHSLLAQELPKLILQLSFPKTMRWSDLEIHFPRPLHWVVALFEDKVVSFSLADVIFSGNESRGHAQLSPRSFTISHANLYPDCLREHYVLADVAARKASILEQLAAIEQKEKAHALAKEKVLAEVLYLTEWPLLLPGKFSPRFLEAPKEVLISEMVAHQRYFPLAQANGALINSFVITADNTPNDTIRKGNERVLSARLSDGLFLYQEDLKTPLLQFNEMLKKMTFQKELGSMFQKVERIVLHAEETQKVFSKTDKKKSQRAALLCKADLASQIVREFPELQGTMGKIYAQAQNEDPEVAEAIEEQWLPNTEGGALPQTGCGTILSLADKIDNLLGYFSVGLKPTSSSDPYALRRQTIGLLKIVLSAKKTIDIKDLLLSCSAHFPKPIAAETIQEILSFITARAKGLFEELGFKKEEIEASFNSSPCNDPYDLLCKLQALKEFRLSGEDFTRLVEVYKRAKGQLEKESKGNFQENLAQEPAEKELLIALKKVEQAWPELIKAGDYKKAFHLLASLQKPLSALFDSVKILCDEADLRENRIALLQKVFYYFGTLLDFSKIH